MINNINCINPCKVEEKIDAISENSDDVYQFLEFHMRHKSDELCSCDVCGWLPSDEQRLYTQELNLNEQKLSLIEKYFC